MAKHFALKSLYTPESVLIAFKIWFQFLRQISTSSQGEVWLESCASWSPDKAFAGFIIHIWERQRSGLKDWAQELVRSENPERDVFGINISGMNSSPHLQAQISLQTQYMSHFILKYKLSLSTQIFSPQDTRYSMCTILNVKKYLNQIYILQTL